MTEPPTGGEKPRTAVMSPSPARSTLRPLANAGAASLLPPPFLSDEDRTAARRLQLFMGTRLGVATLLLGGTLLLALENQRGMDSFTPRFLVSLIAAIYGGSLIFSVWMLGTERRDRVALTQVASDLLVTTGLVYVTGGPSSGFTFLYGVAVLMAAMVVGPGPARITGGIAIGLYTTLVVSLALQWIAVPPDQVREAYLPSTAELVNTALLNVLGLLLVTLLASNLSGRLLTAGGRLRLAEASAATLARLNDDIVRSLTSGLLTTDLEGKVRTINPAGVEILHADPFLLVGEPVSSYLPVDEATLRQLRLDGDNSPPRAEGTAIRLDGTKFPVGYSLNSLINIDGAAIGMLILFQDLSEIVELREAAVRGQRLAVLGQLSVGLAHEIRNPLSSISGSVELVRGSTLLDQEDRRLLGIVLHEVERLDDLVSTMLLVGRPRELQRKQHDLRTLCAEVVEMALRGAATDAGVTIEHDLPSNAVTAWVDGDQIRQVLWNLVKNALQASPPGTTVCVSTRRLDDERSQLQVTDQGRGIDSIQREKIYDMFYSERTHGAGIGLALVRQIVDAHGGIIDISSTQHQGATFLVTLPHGGGGASAQSHAAQLP